jgi:hypothetical protein
MRQSFLSADYCSSLYIVAQLDHQSYGIWDGLGKLFDAAACPVLPDLVTFGYCAYDTSSFLICQLPNSLPSVADEICGLMADELSGFWTGSKGGDRDTAPGRDGNSIYRRC